MKGLQYFLDNKLIKKISEANKTNLFYAKIPSTIIDRFNFNFKKQIKKDRFLYDYFSAYKINSDSKTINEIDQLEILALLTIDGNLDEKNSKVILKKIDEISNGRKPIGKDERKIWNLFEAISLIKKEKFEINEYNYELFIHIIFRNIGLDLDSQKSYLRNEDIKTNIKGLINHSMIKEELYTLLNYIKNLKDNDISGFTQAFLIFIDFLFISPYKQFNFIIAYLLYKWFLLGIDREFEYTFSVYKLGLDLDEFIKTVEIAFTTDFNLDNIFELLSEYTISKINMIFKLDVLNTWIFIEKKLDSKIFEDSIDKMLLVNMLNFPKDEWLFTKINNYFNFKNKIIFNKDEIEIVLKKLVNENIVEFEQTKNSYKFKFKDREFEKLRVILRDKKEGENDEL